MSKNTNIADLINYISVDGSGNVVLTTGGQVATQSYVTTAVSNLVNSAPSTLDTLNELATALGNDANFATTVTTSIATKLPLAGGTLTGPLTITGGRLFLNGNATDTKAIMILGDATYPTASLVAPNTGGTILIAGQSGTGMTIGTTGNATFSGNVGISTTSPQTLLQILKDTNTNGTNIEESNMAFSVLSAVGQSKIAIGACNAGNYGYIQVMQDATSWTNRNLTLQPRGGNVGVGTYTPNSRLDVASTYVSDTATQVMFRDNTGGGLLFGGTGGAAKFLQAQDFNGAATYYNILLNPRGGNVLIGTSTSDAGRLQIQTSGNGLSYSHSFLSMDNSAYKTAFLISHRDGETRLMSTWAGSGINSDITFWTTQSNGNQSEKMRISSSGDLYLSNGAFQQQGVWTVFNSGFTDGTSSFNFDIGVGDEGGGGNIFKVEAGFAHYSAMGYNCLAEFYISTRGTGSEITDVIRRDTSLAGSFTAWKTTSTVLRINKSAGTYPGGGRYWIKVTKVNY